MKARLEQVEDVTARATASWTEALAILADAGTDAVLLDLLMPTVDGVELTRRIRAAHPGVPIVVTSASANVQRAVQAIRAGATEFLPKPLDVAAFMRIVASGRREDADLTSSGGTTWTDRDTPAP